MLEVRLCKTIYVSRGKALIPEPTLKETFAQACSSHILFARGWGGEHFLLHLLNELVEDDLPKPLFIGQSKRIGSI